MPNYAEYGIILPNQYPPVGEVRQKGIEYGLQQQQNLAKLLEEKRKNADANETSNLSFLNQQQENFDKNKTGSEAINEFAQNQVKQIFDKYRQVARTAPKAQYQGAMINDLHNISQWFGGTHTAYENGMNAIDALTKDKPNLDRPALVNMLMHDIASSRIQTNPDGTKQIIPYEKTGDYDPTKLFGDPTTLALATNDVSTIPKYLHGLDSKIIRNSDEVNKKGYVDKEGYSYNALGDLQQIEYDKDGNPVAAPLKFTESSLTDAAGKPLRMLPDSLYTTLHTTSGVGNALDKLWLDNQEKEVVDWAKRNGRIPTTKEREDLKKAFEYKYVSQFINPQISRNEKTVVPKPPITNNTFNLGNTSINDVYNEVASKFNQLPPNSYLRFNALSLGTQKQILDAVNANLPEADKVNASTVEIRKLDDGRLHLTTDTGADLAPLDYKSLNLPANTSQKQKQVILKHQTTQPTTNEFEQYKRNH